MNNWYRKFHKTSQQSHWMQNIQDHFNVAADYMVEKGHHLYNDPFVQEMTDINHIVDQVITDEEVTDIIDQLNSEESEVSYDGLEFYDEPINYPRRSVTHQFQNKPNNLSFKAEVNYHYVPFQSSDPYADGDSQLYYEITMTLVREKDETNPDPQYGWGFLYGIEQSVQRNILDLENIEDMDNPIEIGPVMKNLAHKCISSIINQRSSHVEKNISNIANMDTTSKLLYPSVPYSRGLNSLAVQFNTIVDPFKAMKPTVFGEQSNATSSRFFEHPTMRQFYKEHLNEHGPMEVNMLYALPFPVLNYIMQWLENFIKSNQDKIETANQLIERNTKLFGDRNE